MARTELWSMDHQRAVPKWLIALAVVALVVRIISDNWKLEHEGGPSLVKWVALSDSAARAAATKRPIMYDFSAEWCGPCKQMDRAVFDNPKFAARINNNLVPVHVIDRKQEDGRNPPAIAALQQIYHVNAFPTLIVADANGHALTRMEGFRGPQEFETQMKRWIGGPIR